MTSGEAGGDPSRHQVSSGEVDDLKPEGCGSSVTRIDGNELSERIAGVEEARRRYLAAITDLTTEGGAFRPDVTSWSIAQVTEHLVHAELGGINLIWRAADGVRRGAPVWSGVSPNRGLTIDEIVERTWAPREASPESAIPRIGGPLGYWAASLRNCTGLLRDLGSALAGLPLEEVVYPHVISGPLDARQRLQFLACHLDRHRRQVLAIRRDPGFPVPGEGERPGPTG